MRRMLSAFPTEKLKLIKSNGQCIENIEALVQPKKIFVDDASVIIEEGDVFERILGNGATEYYEVLDRGYYKGTRGIPDHYKNGIGSIRFNPHCGVDNNLFCVSLPSCSDSSIRSNLTTRLLKNFHQRRDHFYLYFWLEWWCIYSVNTPFKELECSETIKHTMHILVPVML